MRTSILALIRFSSALLFTAGAQCLAQMGVDATPNKTIKPIPVPTQTYACIDISNTNATNDVSLIALDDDNKAAFAYQTQTESLPVLNICQWYEGSITNRTTLNLSVQASFHSNDSDQPPYPLTYSYQPGFLLTDGEVYGARTGYINERMPPVPPHSRMNINIGAFKGTSGDPVNVDLPLPYTLPSAESMLWGIIINGANANGFVGQQEDDFLGYYLFASGSGYDGGYLGTLMPSNEIGYIYSNKSQDYIVFDPNPDLITGRPDIYRASTLQPFYPTASNQNRWAIGTDGSGTGLVWENAGDPIALGATDYPVGLNEQNQVAVNEAYPGEGYLWENGSRSILHLSGIAGNLLGEVFDTVPYSISDQDKPFNDQIIHILASSQNRTEAGEPVENYVWTRNNGKWTFAKMILPENIAPNLDAYTTINKKGVIMSRGFISGGKKRALLLVPVTLTNIADPTKRNGAYGSDMPIQLVTSGSVTSVDSIAWIAASDTTRAPVITGVYPPRMPRLVATSGSFSHLTYCWKLKVVFHDRDGNGHRDFDTDADAIYPSVPADNVAIPSAHTLDTNVVNGWVQITGSGQWNIYRDPDWVAEVTGTEGFFGGDAVLSLKILDNNGYIISPQQDYKFRIEGENPDPATCKAFIRYLSGYYWWAYAIAKHETKWDGGREYYNQFLDTGSKSSIEVCGKEGRPDWNNDGSQKYPVHGSGGYGLFQLTYAANEPNFVMPRKWIWNWQENVRQGINDINLKFIKASAWVDSQQAVAKVLIPKLSVPREVNPDSGDEKLPHIYPPSEPAAMYGGDSTYGYPTFATVSFYDSNDTTKPINKGEIFEAAESIKMNNGLGGTGHYVQWDGRSWKFSRNRVLPTDNKSYVDLVTMEIESVDNNAVPP